MRDAPKPGKAPSRGSRVPKTGPEAQTAALVPTEELSAPARVIAAPPAERSAAIGPEVWPD